MSYGRKIGRGAFTTCYLRPDRKSVTLITCDPLKELYTTGWLPDSFPTASYIDEARPDSQIDYREYRMKYYPRTSGLKNHLDASEWEKYKIIRDAIARFCDFYHLVKNGHSILAWQKCFSQIADPSIKDEMLTLVDYAGSYTSSLYFEISPRNVAVDNGKLILLDIIFCYDMLRQVKIKSM